MDTAVGLVQAYLHINGYFTVTEYPVIEMIRHGGYRPATDIDILAVRFPGAGRMVPGQSQDGSATRFEPDPDLCSDVDAVDMIIGEVKEGRAELNRGARDPNVLRCVLTRFGCCPPGHVNATVEALLRHGRSEMPDSHRVRLIAFGASVSGVQGNGYEVVSLGHVLEFTRAYLHEHWPVLRQAQFKQSALSTLMLLEKVRSMPR